MEQIIYIKIDLVLNNLKRLIYHKTQQIKPIYLSIYLSNRASLRVNFIVMLIALWERMKTSGISVM